MSTPQDADNAAAVPTPEELSALVGLKPPKQTPSTPVTSSSPPLSEGAATEAGTIDPELLRLASGGKFVSAPPEQIPPAPIGQRSGAGSSFEPPEARPGRFNASATPLDLLDDVELDVRIELGRTEMYIEDVLRLGVDSVVELDKLAGDPVDIFVNDQLIARGEVLVLNDNFCVRINDILSPTPDFSEEAG